MATATLPDGSTTFVHWMAFQCRYGPESQAQIEWHIKRGTPGAENWEVGVPVTPCPE